VDEYGAVAKAISLLGNVGSVAQNPGVGHPGNLSVLPREF
jgi:hypothetical protein